MDIVGVYIGNEVNTARKRLGLTQEQLAQKAKISRVSVANLEAGRQCVTMKGLFRYAEALGCKPHELMPSIQWWEKNKNKKVRIEKKVIIY